jgi:hypothetical protein
MSGPKVAFSSCMESGRGLRAIVGAFFIGACVWKALPSPRSFSSDATLPAAFESAPASDALAPRLAGLPEPRVRLGFRAADYVAPDPADTVVGFDPPVLSKESSLKEGAAALQAENFDPAKESFLVALSLDPSDATALRGLRAAFERTKDLAEGESVADPDAFRKGLAADILEEARSAVQESRPGDAVQAANVVLRLPLLNDEALMQEARDILSVAGPATNLTATVPASAPAEED